MVKCLTGKNLYAREEGASSGTRRKKLKIIIGDFFADRILHVDLREQWDCPFCLGPDNERFDHIARLILNEDGDTSTPKKRARAA